MITFKKWLESGPANFSTFDTPVNVPEIVAKINNEKGTGGLPTYSNADKPPVPKKKYIILKKSPEKKQNSFLF